jgi:hypothetical protein
MGHRAGLNDVEKRKTLPFLELNPGRQIIAHRYTDLAVPAYNNENYKIFKCLIVVIVLDWFCGKWSWVNVTHGLYR